MKKAFFYSKEKGAVRCALCPHICLLKEGQYGRCSVRRNIGGELYTLNYGITSALHLDPVEKKPLYHFYPGKTILSIGSVGCNLRCLYCQNYSIAQGKFEEFSDYRKDMTPGDILQLAEKYKKEGNIGVAYTYNEPVIWYEYMLDIAREIKRAGMKNIMVSNGFINQEPLEELLKVIDAFSVDLKGFTEEFYREITGSRLEPVKETLKKIAGSGKHLEIEYLVIPGHNDDEKLFGEMIRWYRENLGKEIPLHINRYFPAYKMDIPATPVKTLESLYRIAKKRLDYVYLGNVREETGRDTFCPDCGNLLIERDYFIDALGILNGGCSRCGKKIKGEGLCR